MTSDSTSSSVCSSTAPTKVSALPSASTITSAGCAGTSKCENTYPGSSLSWGKVRPCLSMNPWKVSSVPTQATPTKATWSPHFWCAASTEGASALQLPQVGAQNQNAAGAPATEAPSNVPPPTSGLLNCSDSGTPPAATESWVTGLSVTGEGPLASGASVLAVFSTPAVSPDDDSALVSLSLHPARARAHAARATPA